LAAQSHSIIYRSVMNCTDLNLARGEQLLHKLKACGTGGLHLLL